MSRPAVSATHRVWLGSRASIWGHRGYTVRGESVMCVDLADAESVVAASLGDDAIEVAGDNGGTYYYDSQESADADLDGSRADAVVVECDATDEAVQS